MATTESWVLNGLDISTGNYQILELDVTPPKERPEWITAADSEWGALSRQPKHENRVITMRIRVAPQASMNTALDRVGSIVDQLRNASETPDGVPLVWTAANSTRTATFDVLDGEITELPITLNDQGRSWFSQRPIVTLQMTCKPYYRYTETTVGPATSGTAPFVSFEVASVPGDIPALARLIVTDSATQNRRHVEWGVESQYYNSGTSLIIDSDSMTVSGFAGTQTAVTGAYDPNATGSSAVQLTSVPTVPVALAGTGALSHVGTFRVWARFQTGTLNHRVRLAWRVGDGPYRANDWATPTVISTDWNEQDLGLITISPAAVGTQRWDGRVEIYDIGDPGSSATFSLDYLLLVPAAEGYGAARAVYRYTPGVLVARDDFTGTTAGGTLNTRVAPSGGTWATTGAATDFTFSDAGAPSTQERIQRATTSDAAGGRSAILGSTNYTDVEVGSRIFRTSAVLDSTTTFLSLFARWVDANNYIELSLLPPAKLQLFVVVAGVPVLRLSNTNFIAWGNTWYRLRLVAYASGRMLGQLLDDNGNAIVSLTGTSSAVATGGALATGKPGIRDSNNAATAVTRLYDDFYAATPVAEPISLYSGRTIEFRHDQTIRQDSGGTYYGRPPSYRGSRFLLPTGTSRVMVKARRNDPVTADATNVADNTSISVAYTPRGLVVPR